MLKQFLKCRITQLYFLFGVQNQNAEWTVLNQSVEIRGPLYNPLLKIVVRSLQSDISLLEPVQHAIKLVEEEPDLVIASFRCADAIVFLGGNRRRRIC